MAKLPSKTWNQTGTRTGLKALDRKLLRDLWQMRGQVLAILLIVSCGIASLVTMSSTYDSLSLTQSTYYDRYRFADVFVQLKRAPESLVERVRAIPDVQQVQSRVVMDVTLDVPGLAEPATGRLVSIPEQQSPMLNDLYLRQGRYIEPGHRDEVLASEVFAQANDLKIGDRLGAVINGRWQALRIVGIALSPEYVYEIRGTELVPDNQRFGVLWMGREALGTAFDMEGGFNDLSLTLMPGASEAEVLFQLDHLLERYGGLGAYGRKLQISNQFVSDEIRQLSAHAVLMPSIFLGIAVFLLNLLLGRLVSTQRDQIAVMKAFGYSNGDVGLHYLKLVLVVVLAGAVLGTAMGISLGALMTQFYTNFYHFPILNYEAGGRVVSTAVLVSTTAAIAAAFMAVRRAVQLPTAEAMRPEPPASYRPTLLERLGLQRLFSPSSRIILRNLERRPIQALMSVVGIATAIAILVVGRYFEDAMAYIVDVQFRTVQREDITLVFHQPRSQQAKYDLAALPGVMRVEPFRSVPARLRFEHRSRRSGIIGLSDRGELRRLLDIDLNQVALPPDGIVLSSKLAELLGSQIGDALTVEILEGARPVRRIPVVEIIDELVGLSAYMDINALNQLMQEGPTLSGAYLMVDENHQQKLYQQFKQTPAVASVSLRKTIIEKFNEIIGSSMAGFNGVLIFFASIIAFGVVYNAARMALSERSRELATLRIIGFSQAEIAFILLGEQAVILLAALPLGFAMGYGLAALITQSYSWELFRFPLIVTPKSYAFAFVVIAGTALVSGFLIRRQLNRLDLIAVLKTRE